MIDRTTFDLRLADHSATTARIDRADWRHQGTARPRPLRARAAAPAALIARLLRVPRWATPAASPQPGGTA